MTLAFRGKVFKERMNARSSRETYRFELMGIEKGDLEEPVSADYSVTATEVATIAKALIDSISNPYIYYTTDSIPTSSVTFKTKYEAIELAEALDELADRIDGIWWVEPDGLISLKKLTVLDKRDVEFFSNYHFNDDTIGSAPANWTTNNSSSCTTEIISGLDGIKNVLELDDQNGSGYCEIYRSVTQSLSQTFEFYIGKDSVGADTILEISFYEGVASRKVHLRLNEDDLQEYDGQVAATWTNIKAACLTANEFIHVKIIFNDVADTYDLYIDGTLEGNDIPYENASTNGIDKIQLRTDSADTGYKGYFAVLGSSSASNYSVGDNLKGLCNQTKLISPPSYESDNRIYNYIHLYGKGYIESDGDSKDDADILINGKVELIRYYPGCNDVTQLQNIAASLLTKDGIATRPIKIECSWKSVDFVTVGRNFLFTWDFVKLLKTPTTYVHSGVKLDMKGFLTVLLTNSTFQKGREYDYE
jgi:hypothetical protein